MQPMKPLVFTESRPWWPEEFGSPSASGSQNDLHYAYFRAMRRLLVREGEHVNAYDTEGHDIQGILQASDLNHARFTSAQGEVSLAQLKRL